MTLGFRSLGFSLLVTGSQISGFGMSTVECGGFAAEGL